MERTLVVRLRLRYDPAFLRPWLAGALVLLCAGSLASEDVTLSTYYPAPSGVYSKLVTTAGAYLARDSGKVGIGTATPSSELEVKGAGSTNVDLTVNGRIQTGDASANGGVWLSNANNMFVGQNGTNVGFWTAGAGFNALQVAQNGNVGIGTTSPAASLQISGGSGRGYLFIDNTNTGCFEKDESGDVWNSACPGGDYITSQPGIFIEGWSYYNRGGQVLAQTGAGQATTQVWGLNNCSGGGTGCSGNPTWMTLKKDDSIMHVFCCPK
ncbi:MAG: hypothetical protein KGM24_14720 [Elusimicrobia bacterium]|nr:hypothetical protein [Elusimicrobiota bacterium]